MWIYVTFLPGYDNYAIVLTACGLSSGYQCVYRNRSASADISTG